MSETSLKSLTADTVRLIGSSQVITSVYSVIKELVENALDAGATTVDVKLENYGLDRIEVRDNGWGIPQCDMKMVAKRYHTSKINSFSDLESLVTYGFRGEALGSLCAVSSLSITTKTMKDEVSMCTTFDPQGEISGTKPSHLGQGTTVTACKLFKNLPVRRQMYSTVKKKKDELRKVEDLMICYGIIRPEIRLSLRHDKDLVWQKVVMADSKMALQSILGRNIVSKMKVRKMTQQNPEIQLEVYLPEGQSDVQLTSRSTNDRCIISVNRRPVQLKEMEKCIRRHYVSHHGCEMSRYPVFFVSLVLPSSQIDVNLDPNKSQVMLHYQKDILTLLTSVLEELYGPVETSAKSKSNHETDSSCTERLSSQDSLESSDSQIEAFIQNVPSSDLCSKAGNADKCSYVNSNNETLIVKNATSKTAAGLENTDTLHSQEAPYTGLVVSFHDGIRKSGSHLDQKNAAVETLSNSQSVEPGSDNGLGGSDQKICDSGSSEPDSFNISGEIFNLMDRSGFQAPSDGEITDENGNEKAKNSKLTHTVKPVSDASSSPDVQCFTIHAQDSELDDLLCTWPDSEMENSDTKSSVVQSVENSKFEMSLKSSGEMAKSSVSFCDITNSSVSTENNSSGIGSTKDTSMEWSKGQRLKLTDGQTVHPVKLLVPGPGTGNGKRSFDESISSSAPLPPAKRKSLDVQFDQPRLYDVISSSPSINNTGFIAFSKENRTQVVEENPDLDYTEISDLMRKRWAELAEIDKRMYRDAGQQEIQRLKKSISEKQRKDLTSVSKLQIKEKTVKVVTGLPSIRDQMLAASKAQKTPKNMEVPVKTVKVPFSMQALQEKFTSGLRQSQINTPSQLQLIGTLKLCNGWICCHGNKIQALNPQRVDEVILHRQLMANHVLPICSVDQPIRLEESNMGGAGLWQTLQDMTRDSQHTTYTLLEDERLLSNGISIRCHSNHEGHFVLDLVGLCQVIPTYGLKDVKEVLDLIHNAGADTLLKARPLKVINYLKGEAVRMIRQRPLQRSHESIVDLLDQMPVDCRLCLHNKPFLQTLYDLDDVPLTQTQK